MRQRACQRTPAGFPATIRTDDGRTRFGRVSDLTLDGLFVRMDPEGYGRELAVVVECVLPVGGRARALRIPARVLRRSDAGLALVLDCYDGEVLGALGSWLAEAAAAPGA